MRIVESARRHGVGDEDMLHAVAVPLRVIDFDDDGETTLYIGGGRDGACWRSSWPTWRPSTPR